MDETITVEVNGLELAGQDGRRVNPYRIDGAWLVPYRRPMTRRRLRRRTAPRRHKLCGRRGHRHPLRRLCHRYRPRHRRSPRRYPHYPPCRALRRALRRPPRRSHRSHHPRRPSAPASMGGMGVSEGGARPPRPPPRRGHKSGVLYKEWDGRNGSRAARVHRDSTRRPVRPPAARVERLPRTPRHGGTAHPPRRALGRRGRAGPP